ncbi:beta-lactamase family protein [Mycolicibacterium fluoranthenivorans]|uniref:Beta-lactamase family protein n=1 Tax=Mycolicibacterium fluoranthenivorans TaxID=258505 RepID=A0A7G8PGC5_9MYCO|nr:serine hydrolase domain-containing protein [Mycolicibacterium fluoranthenivorans]QNJ93391.1 beta-lactamase family protein [Mycolicibacterium fluoranthenivorans]
MVDQRKLSLLIDRVALEVTAGRLPSAQIAVGHQGELAAFEVFGAAKRTSRYRLQSVSRPFVAGVLWKVVDEYGVDITTPVSTWIPGFCAGITLEDIATHRAGLAYAPLGAKRMATRESRLEAMSRWQPDPETRGHLQFSLTSSGWVIWEVVESLTGMSLPDYLAQHIAGPLGLTARLAVPVEAQGDVAPMALLGRAADELDPWGPWYLESADVLARGEPSHSVVATAADVVMHYQGMLHSDVWSRDAVAQGIRPRAVEPVHGPVEHGGTDYPVSVGLFVTVRGESWQDGWMPATASPETFGHGGAPCQQSFCDPTTGISFAFLTNGYPASGYALDRWGKNLSTVLLDLAGDLA